MNILNISDTYLLSFENKNNLEKCTFCIDKVVFLGFVVSGQDVEVDEENIKAIRDWMPPQNVSQVRSFIGFAGFYRRFVKDFSIVAAHILKDN
jgi:hypothetical protein